MSLKVDIPLNPYPLVLWALFTKDPSRDVAALNLKYKGLNIAWDNGAAAYTHDYVYDYNKIIVVFDTDHIDLETIAHEIIHIKNLTYTHSGVKHSADNDEHEAYFVGWLMKELSSIYKQNTKKPLK